MRIRQRARRLQLRWLSPRDAARKGASRQVALWNAIERGHDPDLRAMRDERDMLKMNYEMSREVHSEWGAQARRFAPLEGSGCACDICAITRALNKVDALPAMGMVDLMARLGAIEESILKLRGTRDTAAWAAASKQPANRLGYEAFVERLDEILGAIDGRET